MPKLIRKDIWDCTASYTTENIELTTGYGQNTHAAPFIHAYDDFELAILSAALVLKTLDVIPYRDYTITKFLVVQEKATAISSANVTIKPHRAISSENNAGDVYESPCYISVYLGDRCIESRAQGVHIHGGTLSPGCEVEGLVESIQAVADDDVLVTSYVLDQQNKRLMITEHCLLLDPSCISTCLMSKTDPTTEMLAGANAVLDLGLKRFNQNSLNQDTQRIDEIISKQWVLDLIILLESPNKQIANQQVTLLRSGNKQLAAQLGASPEIAALTAIITSLKKPMNTSVAYNACIEEINPHLRELTKQRNTDGNNKIINKIITQQWVLELIRQLGSRNEQLRNQPAAEPKLAAFQYNACIGDLSQKENYCGNNQSVPEQWVLELIRQLESRNGQLANQPGAAPKIAALTAIITSLNQPMNTYAKYNACIEEIKKHLPALAEHRNTYHGKLEAIFRHDNHVNFFSTKSLKLASIVLNTIRQHAPTDASSSKNSSACGP